VFRRTALAALARAANAGEDHVAREELAGADPLVAWWVRKRIDRHVRWAVSGLLDASDRAHVLRLAYLREAGEAGDVDWNDRAAVREHFERLEADRRPPSRRWRITPAVLVSLVVLGGAVFGILHRPPRFDPRTDRVGHALGEDLTDFVVAVFRARESDEGADVTPVDRARQRTVADLSSALGAGAAAALDALLRAYGAAATARSYDAAVADATTASLQRFNGALREGKAPYLLDVMPDTGRGPLLVSYYAPKACTARARGHDVAIVRVQRLDSLNRVFAMAGYTSPRLGVALVALDMIERDAIGLMAPALSEGATAPLVDVETRRHEPPWARPLEQRAAEVMRSEAAAAYSSAELSALLRLLAERRALYARWSETIAPAAGRLLPLMHLVERDPLDALQGMAAPSELRAWVDVNDKLDEAPARRAFGALLDVMARRIDRHELQHQIDFRGGLLGVPAEVRTIFGMPDTLDVSPGDNAARVRDELSAELAVLASGGAVAGTYFVLGTQPFFDRDLWVTPYAHVGAILLFAVARELGADARLPYRGGALDREAGAELFQLTVGRPNRELAGAAGRAYARIFGTDLPEVELGPCVESPAWLR
jgi:hypothetical protein